MHPDRSVGPDKATVVLGARLGPGVNGSRHGHEDPKHSLLPWQGPPCPQCGGRTYYDGNQKRRVPALYCTRCP
jgi:hypothetical protein